MPEPFPHVDPALVPLIEAFPPFDMEAASLQGFRAAVAGMSVLPDPATHTDVRIETVSIPAHGTGKMASDIRCLLYRPAQRTAAGALLHIHGGGFVMGLPEMDAARNIELARATGCPILSVDYRLAPEHPHPAGLEDCHAALVWLRTQARSLGATAGRVGLIGESAGGGLAAALALLARDRDSVDVACQVLVYPMLMPPSHSLDTAKPDARTGRHIWTRVSNAFAWSSWLGDDPAHLPTVAGLASDLTRLPPAFIAVGDLDLFVHDDLAYAGRLLAAGVSVEAHLYPGAIHGFDRAVDAPVSARFTRDMVDFIRRHLG